MIKIRFILLLFLIFFASNLFSNPNAREVSVYVFWQKGCYHCEKEKVFLKKLQKKYPDIQIQYFEVSESKENLKLLNQISKKMGFEISGFPITIIGKRYFIGFLDEKTTGFSLEKVIIKEQKTPSFDVIEALHSNEKQPYVATKSKEVIPEKISIPFFGQINIKHLSLPLITLLFGAIDGFNPCAMWALVMLISFLIVMKDKKKIILLGSLFIFVSGWMYFMFMAAWLNLLIFLSYIKWMKIAIGIIAISGGAYYLKEFWTNKEGACQVTSSKYKQKIAQKLSFFTQTNRLWLAALGICLLAFLVNFIELICSAGLPIVYLQILRVNELASLHYYLYIFLYIFIFMLDDLIVFFIAIFTLQMIGFTTKYSRFSHLIGGAVLLIIGVLLIFKPDLLSF